MRYNKYITFGIPLIVIMLVALSFFDYMHNYHGISLENIACRIPKKMWDGADDKYISDHMFYIRDSEDKYLIYGSQLEKFNEDDEKCGLINDVDAESLLGYNDAEQLSTAFMGCTDFLGCVSNIWKTERPSYIQYCIMGEGRGVYEDYMTYIVTLREKETSFVEIILYKSPEVLSKREKKELYKHINYLFD